MEPLHSAKADAEPLQLSSKISLNLDDETSEKTSCWQQFRSLKRKYYWILITILLAVIASIVIGTTIGFSAQSGDEPQLRLQNETTFRPNLGNIGSYLLLCFTLRVEFWQNSAHIAFMGKNQRSSVFVSRIPIK